MLSGARSARQLVRDAVEKLDSVGVPEPVASAEVLLAELLGVRRSELALREEPLTTEQAELYETWIARRLNREPVQRILGYAYFRNLVLELDEHTLIPRPDTESVVDAALEAIDRRGAFGPVQNPVRSTARPLRKSEVEKPGVRSRDSGVVFFPTPYSLLPTPWSEATQSKATCLDLGTGSGAIAVSIARKRPSCVVHATDNSEGALRVARRNAASAGVTVYFHRTDLVFGLDSLSNSIDVLVSNPPYVRSADISELAAEVRDGDPRAALDGGPDGLDFYRRILAEATPLLVHGADVVLEVGDGQAESVLELGYRAGYSPLGTHADTAGTPRAVLLRWGSN